MQKYRITPRVRDELLSIGRYTKHVWGSAQRNQYLKNLENRFAWLAESPYRGRSRPEIGEGYYSFPQGQHVVFYKIRENFIEIIGIPHKQMDDL